MKRVLPFVLFGFVLVTIVAASGQDGKVPDPATTRFRVAILKVPVMGNDSVPLRLADLGEAAAGAVVARGAGASAEGFLASLPYSKKIRERILARDGAEVVYRGEMEASGGAEAYWRQSTKVPIVTVSVRGNQPTVSTTYEAIGAKVKLAQRGPDRYLTEIEFSMLNPVRDGRLAFTTSITTQGTVNLADGRTAIFEFLDRVDGDFTRRLPMEVAEGKQAEVVVPSIAFQYFVLLTRTDFD